MHHHNWDSWLHFPLAAVWMSEPWWIEKLQDGGHFLTLFAPYMAAVIAVLQVAYLIRKHLHFKK